MAPDELAKLPAEHTNKPVVDTPDLPFGQTLSHMGRRGGSSELSARVDRAGDFGIGRVPDASDKNHQQHNPPSRGDAASVASPTASSQIEPSEPLAHEVGLLSLSNSTESKYLGPSSGVSFARLIFSAIPQSQGLAIDRINSRHGVRSRCNVPQPEPFPPDWTPGVDLQHFVDAYFENLHPMYPFLDEDAISERLEVLYAKRSPALNPQDMSQLFEIESIMSPTFSVQIFLIVALGSRILETRLAANFSSERYLATAQARINDLGLPLHDTVEGLQIMLLLTLSSFYFENGPNAWFLNSTIIASCLDLGFQRRWTNALPRTSLMGDREVLRRKNIRSAIFWSSYSIERRLAVVLGRPLTIRDEAIDVEFPWEGSLLPRASNQQDRGCSRSSRDANDLGDDTNKRLRLEDTQYAAARYSFRLHQLVAEIKLMLHRVVNLPERFPWPTDLVKWQTDVHAQCDTIIDDVFTHLKWRSRRSTTDVTVRSLELKYHFNLMLLHRPSPAIPQPSIDSWNYCYHSAVKTIMIYSDLHRFSKLPNTWLTAHTVFVSGITFVYCIWVQPQIKNRTTPQEFASNATACTALLEFLGKTWSVAADATEKFQRLAQLAISSWVTSEPSADAERPGVPISDASRSLATQPVIQGRQGYDTVQAVPSNENENVATAAQAYATDGGKSGGEPESAPFLSELEDVSSWFDLDWLMNMNSGPSGEIISYPA